MLISARTSNDTICTFDDWLSGDQINGPVLADNLCCIREASISVIILVVSLKSDVNKLLFNQITTTKNRFLLTCPVCVTSAPLSAARNAPAACVVMALELLQ